MGRVIKAQRMGPAWLPAELFDARNEAKAIIARAHASAAAVQREAYATGYAAGQADAAKLLATLTQQAHERAARTERDAMQAVLLVAAQLLGRTLEARPEEIASLLSPQLARMRRGLQLVLRLHPDDAAWLDAHPSALAELRQRHQLKDALTVRHDPRITRGGCVIESTEGELDARIETRLELLAQALGLTTHS
jgi:flagellar assembly protein FliH